MLLWFFLPRINLIAEPTFDIQSQNNYDRDELIRDGKRRRKVSLLELSASPEVDEFYSTESKNL